jgi:dTDP-4-dehydrorhamnose 3,5-epimerase
MKFTPLPLEGAYLINSEPFKDHRGWFYRAFCSHELRDLLGGRQIMQINISCTETLGAIRGLHFQYPPHAEMKLIRCLRGAVWDVAMEFRKGSRTFLQWHAKFFAKN